MESGAVGTLLVIDDSEPDRRELVTTLRTGKDFGNFLEARDGISGLKILTNEAAPVDVVACDLNMPGMDGFQFLRAARAKPEFMGIPIVMITSQSEDSDMVKAFELRANDFIIKPFNKAILRARLKNMLHIKHLQDLLKAQKEMMEQMATTDPLTNIHNVRFFRRSLEYELSRAYRYSNPLSILLIDLDHFKKVNDTFGHPRGDTVLCESAGILVKIMRRADLVARYGGEEFVVVMPSTDQGGARKAAERLRQIFEKHTFEGLEEKVPLTISIGLATADAGMKMGAEKLVDLADQALYTAKLGGRNRVEISRACVE